METINKIKIGIISLIMFIVLGLLLHTGVTFLSSFPLAVTTGLILTSGLLIYFSYKVIST